VPKDNGGNANNDCDDAPEKRKILLLLAVHRYSPLQAGEKNALVGRLSVIAWYYTRGQWVWMASIGT
jgi:hypothetical protein